MEAIDLAARAGSAWDHVRLRRMQQRIDRVESVRDILATTWADCQARLRDCGRWADS